MPNVAIYNGLIFEVEDDSRPIFFIKTQRMSHKKMVDSHFVVDSKRCVLGEYEGKEVWMINGINSVRPI